LEIARALRYLHSLDAPIVHLVLTPDDIFYQADDYNDTVVLKLGNFSEARRMSQHAR
jgi:serine/threonine protein kinase